MYTSEYCTRYYSVSEASNEICFPSEDNPRETKTRIQALLLWRLSQGAASRMQTKYRRPWLLSAAFLVTSQTRLLYYSRSHSIAIGLLRVQDALISLRTTQAVDIAVLIWFAYGIKSTSTYSFDSLVRSLFSRSMQRRSDRNLQRATDD